jgi:nucleoside-diphosphate-sugar epimerase
MRVFAAGATGVVGRRLVPQLVAQAHHATATATATATNPGMVEQQATGVFNIVDDEPAPASEWLPYLAARASAKPPLRLATWLARPLAGEVAVAVATEGHGFSNAKAKRKLGWELRHPSWRHGFTKELA